MFMLDIHQQFNLQLYNGFVDNTQKIVVYHYGIFWFSRLPLCKKKVDKVGQIIAFAISFVHRQKISLYLKKI